MKHYADLGGCYPPQPSASADNTLLDLHNSSYHTQPHPIIANYSVTIIIIVIWSLSYTVATICYLCIQDSATIIAACSLAILYVKLFDQSIQPIAEIQVMYVTVLSDKRNVTIFKKYMYDQWG